MKKLRRLALKCGLYVITALFMVSGWVLIQFGVRREAIIWLLRGHAVTVRRLLLPLFGIKVRFIGLEKPLGKSIVASNHEGWLETVLLWLWSKDPTAWAIKELFEYPFIGACYTYVGIISVDPEERGMKAIKLMHASKAALDKGKSLFVFPEGGLGSPEAPELEYQLGIYFLYRYMKVVPVKVITISVSECLKRFPEDDRDLGTQPVPGTIYVVQLPEIPPGLGMEEFMGLLERRIRTARIALCDMPPGLSDQEVMAVLNGRAESQTMIEPRIRVLAEAI